MQKLKRNNLHLEHHIIDNIMTIYMSFLVDALAFIENVSLETFSVLKETRSPDKTNMARLLVAMKIWTNLKEIGVLGSDAKYSKWQELKKFAIRQNDSELYI